MALLSAQTSWRLVRLLFTCITTMSAESDQHAGEYFSLSEPLFNLLDEHIYLTVVLFWISSSTTILTMFIQFHSKVSQGVLLLVLLEDAGQGAEGKVAHQGQEITVEGDKDDWIGHHLVCKTWTSG